MTNVTTGWGQPIFNTAQNPLSLELAYLGPMTRDQALEAHEKAKAALDKAKKLEMDLRVFSVKTLLNGSKPKEGTNNVQLNNGYVAKAVVKYNYNLADANKVDEALTKFTQLGNDGGFIADRLVTWTPTLSITEYRNLEESAKTSRPHAQMLAELQKVLTVTEAAPTLNIVAPKGK